MILKMRSVTIFVRETGAPRSARDARDFRVSEDYFAASSGAFAAFQPEMPAERCFTFV